MEVIAVPTGASFARCDDLRSRAGSTRESSALRRPNSDRGRARGPNQRVIGEAEASLSFGASAMTGDPPLVWSERDDR